MTHAPGNRRVLAAVAALAAASCMVAVPVAVGGKGKKANRDTDDVDRVAIESETTPPPTPEPTWGPLFASPPPVAAGPLPDGLANTSAQGCNACHVEAHDGWAQTSHATGFASPTFVDAVREAGTPACLSCHLPLASQHAQSVAYDGGDIHSPVRTPNPAYDPTLGGEGVTCAACHVRDGKVVAARPVEGAPHATVWTEDLRTSTFCATCHQLTWPEADKPFYDTWGEWSRSAYAAAGVQCQDCHMRTGSSARGIGVGHDVRSDPSRAVSIILGIDTVRLVRGGAPARVTIRLQNTGAGHHFPTGTPFRGVRLQAQLAGVQAKDGADVTAGEPMVADLVRTIEPSPPWHTLEDTRIPAGGERQWTWQVGLPADAPDGTWEVRISLVQTMRGEAAGEAFAVRSIPLDID